MSKKFKPPQEYYKPFKRREFNGHLWNDWVGIAGELIYAINPAKRQGWENASSEDIKRLRSRHVHAAIAKIEEARIIPKVDIDSLVENQKAGGERYNQLAERADSLYQKIREVAKNIDDTEEISENHPVLVLFLELKEIMAEVNELLYNKPQEFFG
jgi:hypothetical protein